MGKRKKQPQPQRKTRFEMLNPEKRPALQQVAEFLLTNQYADELFDYLSDAMTPDERARLAQDVNGLANFLREADPTLYNQAVSESDRLFSRRVARWRAERVLKEERHLEDGKGIVLYAPVGMAAPYQGYLMPCPPPSDAPTAHAYAVVEAEADCYVIVRRGAFNVLRADRIVLLFTDTRINPTVTIAALPSGAVFEDKQGAWRIENNGTLVRVKAANYRGVV